MERTTLKVRVKTDKNGHAEFGTHGWPPLSISDIQTDDPKAKIEVVPENADGKFVISGADPEAEVLFSFSIPGTL